MPNAVFSQFARGGEAEYRALRQEIDRCALTGHSYQFRQCLLPAGCVPPAADLVFSRDACGYVMFVTPKVSYRGENPDAARFFKTGRQGFGSFRELEECLRAVAAAPVPAQAVTRAAPVRRTDTLTEPEKVVQPRRTLPAPNLGGLIRELGRAVVGQDEAVEAVAFKLYAHVGKRTPARPLSLIFHGPTGVGKSELGKHVAEALDQCCGRREWKFVWTELNTFTEPHSAYRLTGAPPGYVGYEDKPIFEAAADNPHTVFMFDELEKAHPEVIKTFMSVLDEGRLAARKERPGRGRELDFRQCIFLFTTNADLSGGNALGRMGFFGGGEPEEPETFQGGEGDLAGLAARVFAADERGRRALTAGGCLKEIAGRFGGFIAFKPLDGNARVEIVARQIARLGEEYGLRVEYVTPAAIQAVLDRIGGGEAFSVRSHVSVIEGCLTPLFLEHAERLAGRTVRLEEEERRLRLVPALGPVRSA